MLRSTQSQVLASAFVIQIKEKNSFIKAIKVKRGDFKSRNDTTMTKQKTEKMRSTITMNH